MFGFGRANIAQEEDVRTVDGLVLFTAGQDFYTDTFPDFGKGCAA